jgi:hypothetical protein
MRHAKQLRDLTLAGPPARSCVAWLDLLAVVHWHRQRLNRSMGWRERDWAKFTDDELRRMYGTSRKLLPSEEVRTFSAPPRGAYPSVASPRRRRYSARGAAITIVAVVGLVMGLRDVDLPSFRSLRGDEHASVRRPLRLPRSFEIGSTLQIHGRTLAAYAEKPLRLEGHTNARPWHTLETTYIKPRGRYEFLITLSHAGMTNLRIVLPNGDVVAGSTRVKRHT